MLVIHITPSLHHSSHKPCLLGRKIEELAYAGDTKPDPVVPPIPERDGVVVNVLVVLKIALGAYLAFLALFTVWLRPSFFAMFWSILLGLGAGVAYSWLFYATRYKKRLLNDGVRLPVSHGHLL